MLSYHLPDLSSDPLDAPVTNDSHDTLIEIYDRTSDEVKIFNAHSSVLGRRCEYFKVALSEKWARKVDDKFKLRLDVLPDAFETILNGINSGTITLRNLDTNILMELMLVSDILLLHDFFDVLRSKLDEKKEKKDKNMEWCDEDIVSILKTSYRIPSTQDLYLFCQDILVERPSILFESPEFLSIDEELLLQVLKLDIICLPEITIFNKLIEWGIAHTPDYDTLADKTSQINELGNTLEDGLQLIRYNNMSKEERNSIRKFEQILPTEDIRYQLPSRINSPIEPKIISSRFAGLIATWIDRKDPMELPYTFDTPFDFRLVFRMNDRTNFYQDHHKYYNKSTNRTLPTMKCHHGGPSLMIMKLKGSGKIIGAYNPIDWKQELSKNVYFRTSESFIFSCDDRYGANHRLSRVRDFDHAICLEAVNPSGVILKFGEDLIFNYYTSGYINLCIKNGFYEQPIIMKESRYEIEQWEIFKITRKDDQPIMIMNEQIKYQLPPSIDSPAVETKIIDIDFFGLISTWIDKKDPEKSRYMGSNMPFQFTPLFRMNESDDSDSTFYWENNKYYNQSSDQMLPTMKCHHGPSLMIMKLESGEIIGAYNPINWKRRTQEKYGYEFKTTTESFIFSCKDTHGTNHQLSRVKEFYRAICSEDVQSCWTYSHDDEIPGGVLLGFGNCLKFVYHPGYGRRNPIDPYIICRIKQDESYEQPAIISAGDHKIVEWEIFRVARKANQIKINQVSYSPMKRKYKSNPGVTKRPPRNYLPIDSSIIEDDYAAMVATWIDEKDLSDDPYADFDMPFQFTLLFRMDDRSISTDKYYNQSTYHLLPTMKCHHGPSLMIMRIKNSGKIIGAYNPINFKRNSPDCKNKYIYASESFIFSTEDDCGTNPQLSRVKDFDKALSQVKVYPNGVLLKFGEDLSFIYSHGNIHTDGKYDYYGDEEIIWPRVLCQVKENGYYNQPAILPEGRYEIDVWEIFRVVRTR